MKRTVFLLAIFSGTTLYAVSPNEWRFTQAVEVPAPGLVRINLSPETLDAARPNLEDVRILDGSGSEVPYLVDRPMPRHETDLRPQELRTELDASSTRMTLTTATKALLKGVTLQAPPGGDFVKAVRVEGSPDGKGWRELVNGQPIFRTRSGAENLTVTFPEASAANFLRLTIDDSRSAAVPFTGVLLSVAETKAPTQPIAATIKTRDESPGVTRLSIDLGASNATIASVTFEASDPMFTRSVTFAVPQLTNDGIREQAVATGAIYRLDLNGKSEARLEIPIEAQIRSRDLIAIIQNGDSPPLTINSIHVEQRPANIVFLSRAPGRYQLLTGNGQCSAPQYDLSAMSEQLKTAPATELRPSVLVSNAGFQAADALADVSLTGAHIDVEGWKFRRAIQIPKPGAQQLELDPDVLANTSPDMRDLRIVTEGQQLPFLFERPSISRSFTLKAAANDPKKPTFSRWSIKLPQAGAPVAKMSCVAGSPLFQRDMRLWEEVADERGDTYSHELGHASWTRLPNQPTQELIIQIDSPPKSDTMLMETNNGDNPAIELHDFKAAYPVTRLIFKTTGSASQPFWIYYGNADVSAPQYDLNLIANQLLKAERATATLGPSQKTGSTTARIAETLTGSARYIFWSVLAAVVAGLLILISRLLPKTQG